MFDKVLFYVSLPIKYRKQKLAINLNEKPYKDIRYYKKKELKKKKKVCHARVTCFPQFLLSAI